MQRPKTITDDNLIPTQAATLLNSIEAIEAQMEAQEAILSKAGRLPNGLTKECDKTPEWRKAKVEHGRLFIELRKANQQLNKLRKLSHFENHDGKRVAIYKYKD